MGLSLFGCLLEVKLGPQKRTCAVTFVYVFAIETVYRNKLQHNRNKLQHKRNKPQRNELSTTPWKQAATQKKQATTQ